MLSKFDLEAFGYYDPDYEEDIKRGKSPLDMVEEYANLSGQKPDAALYEDLINEEYEEWVEERVLTDYERDYYYPENELKELSDLVYVIYGYAFAKGWDLDEALVRVHQNNLARMRQEDGSILRREDGKIIKNPNTPKVDLSDLV